LPGAEFAARQLLSRKPAHEKPGAGLTPP